MAQDLSHSTPRQRRSWRRFRLRTVLLATTVVAVVLAMEVYPAVRQREAVTLFRRLGGTIRYDYQIDNKGTPIRNATPKWNWLRSVIGDDFLDSAVAVIISNRPVSDAEASDLRKLPHLQLLWMGRTKVSDDIIDSINSLKHLWQLDLSSTDITDAGLKRLRNHPKLTYLQLDGTSVTDEAIESLLQLPCLCEVSLIGTRVTEKGVRRLLEAGKQVRCALDAHVVALDDLGQPKLVLTAGEQVPIRGTFYVPTGAKPYSGPVIVSINSIRMEMGGKRVAQQQISVSNYSQRSPTTYEFNTAMRLPPGPTTVRPGELEVIGLGGTICVDPLLELRPAASRPENQQ